MTKTAAEWAVSLCPWAKPGHYPQMDGSDRRCCKKCQPIEQALKLYALEQMGPMVEAIKKAGRCTECGGTMKTNKTEKCISMWQVDCWKCCLSGLESWAVEALTHYTRLKEEMNERS